MSICTIYAYDTTTEFKYESGKLQKHFEMSNWLYNNGKKEYVYEIHKGDSIHSIWIWKENTKRWGKTATPSKKLSTITETDEVYQKNDSASMEEDQQMNHNSRDKKKRHRRE